MGLQRGFKQINRRGRFYVELKTVPEPIGTATAKTRLPLVLKCEWGTERRNWLDDQRDLDVLCGMRRLQIFWGAQPCKALKTKSRIFKSTKNLCRGWYWILE